MSDIIKVNFDDIICTFEANNKEYCALIDRETDNVFFTLKTQVEGNNYVLTHVSEEDIDKVYAAYEEKMKFLDEIDEFDEESEDDVI